MLKQSTIIACLLLARLAANAETISLKTAMEAKLVAVKATGSKLSFHDKALNLELENTGTKSLSIRIDTASIFRPEDTTYQDIMLAGGDVVVLASHKKVVVQGQSYCVKSDGRAPNEGLNFSYLKQGDARMVKLMAFVGREHITSLLAQDAVWVLSDGHKLSSIYDDRDPKATEKLVKFMAEITGRPIPEVFEEHKIVTTPGAPVYVAKALKMYAKFEWETDKTKTMTLGIYDSAGVMLEPVFENKEIEKGNHRIIVEFESETVPLGNYYIRLMDGNMVFKEQEVKVE